MRRPILALTAGFTLLAAADLRAQNRETVLVDTAAAVFQEIMAVPDQSIPSSLLARSHAVAIIPNTVKAGFLVGGTFGRGVLLVRRDGGWSNPVFLTLGGGSFGFQAGAQATDLILVFRNPRSLNSFLAGRGKVTIGADMSAAAGPVGRTLSAATDASLSSEILTYSRSRGLFAGVSLQGAAITMDWQANVAFYGQVVAPAEILAGAKVPTPEAATRLRTALAPHAGTPATAPATPEGPDPAATDPAAPALRSTPEGQPRPGSTAQTPRTGWKRPGAAADPAAIPTAGPATSPPVLRSVAVGPRPPVAPASAVAPSP
jgi:lipid-binding SYLF domain-containing protein